MHRVLASTPDLIRFVPRAQWIPNPVLVRDVPTPPPNSKPVIGHFPSNRRIKGTGLIIEAFQSLGPTASASPEPGVTRLEGRDAMLLLVEGVPHAHAIELMAGADFVIDQVNDLGIYSLVAIEAMALGKVAACSHDPSLYPEEPPIVRVDARTLRDSMLAWISSPEKWRDFGARGKEYVNRVHNPEQIARRVLRVYYDAMGAWRGHGAELHRYWRRRGTRYRREYEIGRLRVDKFPLQEQALSEVFRSLEFDSAAEVGCGFGRILKRVLGPLSVPLIGIDLSLDQLTEARDYAPTMRGRIASGIAEKLPLRDKSVDLVLASEVFMHLDPEQVALALSEARRVSRKYVVNVDWFEDYMVGSQVGHCFVHDYPALYRGLGLKVRKVPLPEGLLQSIFVADLQEEA
jgi:SAM-dependent methyltransferase